MLSKAGSDYSIVPLSEDNYEDLSELRRVVFHTIVSPDYYRTKYGFYDPDLKSIGFITYYKNKIPVAFYGLIPCSIAYGERKIHSGEFTDAMTHPNHRGKGLYMEINELIVSTGIKQGIKLFFGFPNQNVHPVFLNRPPWHCEKRMQCFEIKVNALPFSYLLKIPVLKNLYKRYQTKIIKPRIVKDGMISNPVLDEGYAGLIRSKYYMDHKAANGAVVVNVAEKSKAWIKAGRSLYLGDLELNGADFETAMDELKKLASRLGIRKIIFQTEEGTELYKQFKKHWNPFETFYILLRDNDSGVPLDSLRFSFGDIDVF